MSVPESGSNLNALPPGATPLVDPFFDSSLESSAPASSSATTSASTAAAADVVATDTQISAAITGSTDLSLELIGPSGGPLLPTPASGLSLMAYAKIVKTAILEFQTQEKQNEARDYLQNSLLNLESAAVAQQLIALYYNISQYAQIGKTTDAGANSDILDINDNGTQLTNTIQSGRTADLAAIDTFNQAVQDYNNGVIDQTQFNAAVDAYNTYFNGRNPAIALDETTYNNSVDLYNAQLPVRNAEIDKANAIATALGLPLLPYLTPLSHVNVQLPTATSSPPAQIPVSQLTTPPGSVPIIPSVPLPPTQSALLATYYTPVVDTAMPALLALQSQLDLNAAYLDVVRNFLTGKVPYLVNSYIQKNPASFAGTSSVAAGGSSLTAMVLGLQAPNLERVLSLGKYNLQTLPETIPNSPQVYDTLFVNSVRLLGNVGLFSSLPATNILAEKLGLIPSESPAVGISVGFGFLKNLTSTISSDSFKNDLQGFIVSSLSDTGLSGQGLIDTAKVLTSTTTLALLQIGLVQAALSLGAPGLISQFLGNVTGIPDGAVQLASTTKGTLTSDILQDTLSRSLISSAVAARFGAGVDASSVNQALGSVLNQPNVNVNDPNALTSALSQEFQQQGLSTQQSDVLSKLAVAELTGSANLPYLSAALGAGVSTSDLPIATLTANLSQGVNPSTVTNAATQSLKTAKDSTDYQLTLADKLVKAGVGQQTADLIARDVTLGLAQASFANAVQQGLLNKELLDTSIFQTLKNKLTTAIASLVSERALDKVQLNSVAELRKAISEELQARGIASSEANSVSNSVIIDLRHTGQNPLTSLGLDQVLGPQALAEKLNAHISGAVASDLGPSSTKKLASSYTLALLGVTTEARLVNQEAEVPASALSLFSKQIQELQSLGKDALVKEWASNLRDLTNPTLELAHLLSRIKEPASVLLSSAVPELGMQQTTRPIDSMFI